MNGFIIDECMTPWLVATARERGHDAIHVSQASLLSTSDWLIADRAIRSGLVLVTNNARDFLRLYALTPEHPGLVVIIPNLGRGNQIRMFNLALDLIEDLETTADHVIEVGDGDRVSRRPWPPKALPTS